MPAVTELPRRTALRQLFIFGAEELRNMARVARGTKTTKPAHPGGKPRGPVTAAAKTGAKTKTSSVRRTAAGCALLFGVVLLPLRDADAAMTPHVLPDRDIKVEYTVTTPGRSPHDYVLSFSAESERVRIDDPEHGLWFLVDLRDDSAVLVVPQLRVVVSAPDLTNLAALLQSVREAQFTPSGEATIAELRCTRYLVLSKQVTGTACLTRSGIALAVSGQDSRGSVKAVADSVTEATVPPDSLAPPSDFSNIPLPRGVISTLLGD
jgi:hypothetical protein